MTDWRDQSKPLHPLLPKLRQTQMSSFDCIIDDPLRTVSESKIEGTIYAEIVRATVVVESKTAKNGMVDRNHVSCGCPRVWCSNSVPPGLIYAETCANKNQQS